MARINIDEVSNLKDVDQLGRFSSLNFRAVQSEINGRLQFDLNLMTNTVSVSFTAANTQVSISHNLGKVPTGYIVCKSSAATSVYDGISNNTIDKIFLRASAIANCNIIVF